MINRNKRTPSEYGVMDYICTFQVCLLGEHLKDYPIFSSETMSIWNWIQKYKPQKIKSRKRKISEYIVDETMLKVGLEFVWLWVAIEPKNKEILVLSISKERNICL